MSDIKGLRELSSDPFGRLLTSLSKKFSAFLIKDQADQVENPEDIFSDGQDVESILRYHNFVMSKKFPISPTNTDYYSPTEPDHDKLRLWIKGKNVGGETHDQSGFNHEVILNGDPILVDGAPFDSGVFTGDTKSLAVRYNRPTSDLENSEYMRVTDSTDLRVSGIATGISYFLRFRLSTLTNENGNARTLMVKYDDSNNWTVIRTTTDGRMVFHIKVAGTEYDKMTPITTILIDTVYDVWLTYAVSGNVQHIYVNNVDKTLTNPGTTTPDSSSTDVILMTRTLTTGHAYGDFYDFMLFREKVVSSTEVGNHYTNKWTLANIPFGQVAISNYSASSGIPISRVSVSLTIKYNMLGSTSTSSTSFTTGSFKTVSFTA